MKEASGHGIRLELFSADTLDRFLPDLLRTEQVFPEDLRETPESIREAMARPGAFGLALFDGGDFAGNGIAFGLDEATWRDLHIDRFRDFDPSVAYLFNIAVLPDFQGRGFGKLLLMEIRERTQELGFTVLAGHFRDNASMGNFLAIGGRDLGEVADWFGTGETYHYGELALVAPTT